MPEEFTAQLDILNNGESKERYGITIEAIPMYNIREEALSFHTKGRGNGYVLNIDGQRIYFSGDTEDIPKMRALQNIDKAFIYMNLPYTMTVGSAASTVLEFKPSRYIHMMIFDKKYVWSNGVEIFKNLSTPLKETSL